jgi:FixJ family two-component response regulator
VRESLPDLLKELGFAVQAFASAEDFLLADVLERTECLIMDVAMPGMTGPELQVELSARGLRVPIVFITAYVDEVARTTVIRRGAVDCLFKPFTEVALMRALNSALRRPL